LQYVQLEKDLAALAEAVRGEVLLAIDTEAAGYHRYHDRVCLLQLSSRDETYVVDTLAVPDLSALLPIFEADETEVVIHDAEYDLRLLGRDHALRVSRLFDTKIAAQFLGEPAIGLANLAEKHLGVRLDKKYQRADWAARPLPADQLAYAAEDTRHLPALRDALRLLLEDMRRLSWAEEEFRLREAVRWQPAEGEDDSWLRVKNTRDLAPRQLAALRELYRWRESVAAEKDSAPFRVVSNEALVQVARGLPDSAAGLAKVPGVPASIQARRGAALLEAVRRALALPETELPVRPRGQRRPPPDPEFETLVDRLKTVRDKAADELALDRGFLMPRQQLEDIARRKPTTRAALLEVPDMRRWQVEALGDALLEAVKR
jgi:ribonuclease D